MSYKIELIPSENMLIIIPLLRQLNNKIEISVLEKRIEDMMQQGYK
jgi:hypothetical protein